MKRSIKVDGIRSYSFHGCMKEEGLIGTWFTTSMEVLFDFSKSEQSDNLHDTLDYSVLATLVDEEMRVKSKLIETVAKRIYDRILKMDGVEGIRLEIRKEHPPIDAKVDSVSVCLQNF